MWLVWKPIYRHTKVKTPMWPRLVAVRLRFCTCQAECLGPRVIVRIYFAGPKSVMYLSCCHSWQQEHDTWSMPLHWKEAVFNKTKQNIHSAYMVYSGVPVHTRKQTWWKDNSEHWESTNGRKCGTFGDYGILSFNGNKIITMVVVAMVCQPEAVKRQNDFLATQARDVRLSA
jgi:hypothetical protein